MEKAGKQLALLISAGMLVSLVACGTCTPSMRTSNPSGTAAYQLAAGVGVVQAIDLVPVQQARQAYRIRLRMEDGLEQALLQDTLPSLEIGDRVRIANGVIERMPDVIYGK